MTISFTHMKKNLKCHGDYDKKNIYILSSEIEGSYFDASLLTFSTMNKKLTAKIEFL